MYPTPLTHIYITYNLMYIRRVLPPEVLTEMQNVIMSLIIAAVSHMIDCVVDSLHYAGGREGKKHNVSGYPHLFITPLSCPPHPTPRPPLPSFGL